MYTMRPLEGEPLSLQLAGSLRSHVGAIITMPKPLVSRRHYLPSDKAKENREDTAFKKQLIPVYEAQLSEAIKNSEVDRAGALLEQIQKLKG